MKVLYRQSASDDVVRQFRYYLEDQLSTVASKHYQGFWAYLLFGAMPGGGSGMCNRLLDIVPRSDHARTSRYRAVEIQWPQTTP